MVKSLLQGSVVVKVGCFLIVLSLAYGASLMVTAYLTSKLIGVTAAIDRAGTQRMRIYAIASLLLQLSDSPSNHVRQKIRHELEKWEEIVHGLQVGTAEHPPVRESTPAVQEMLQDLQERWRTRLRPATEAALAASGPALVQVQYDYLQQADAFVLAFSRMVQVLEQDVAARIRYLYALQITFLTLAAFAVAVGIVFLDRKLRIPLQKLAKGAERLAAGNLNAAIEVRSEDELGQLAQAFEEMAESIRSKIDQITALHSTGQEISSLGHGGLEQELRRIVDRAALLLKTDLAVIMVRHPLMDCWVIEAASGEAFDDIRHEILLFEETPFANQALESGRSVIVDKASLEQDVPMRFRDEFGAKSYVVVPLHGPHHPIGVLILLSTSVTRTFTEWDLHFAEQFASYAAVAIENARLFDAAESETHQLREKIKAVERHVAELTHEVKAPAGRVAEFASWIEHDYGHRLDSNALRYLGWIKKEGSDLANLAERTLDFARLTRLPSPLESVDTQAVVKEVLELLGRDLENRRIRVQIAAELPRFACRRIHLKQVLENLIGNAIKYLGDQPEPFIEIGALVDGQRAVLYVRDNGVGIDPAMTERIFLPFQRLGTTDAPGAGIGLSIVKTVVEQYDGAVWVESSPKKGSSFYVRLPVVAGKRFV